MSRIIVKNLPPRITQEEFKKFFASKGNVTDAKLFYRDGQFRRFGFIGYEEESAAADACEFFNGVYFKQHKINVEFCKDIGEKPLSWKEKAKQQKEFENQIKKQEEEKKKEKKKVKEKPSFKEELIKQHEDDQTFKEFLKLQESNIDDETELVKHEDDNVSGTSDEDGSDDDSGKLANKDVSDLEYLSRLKTSTTEDADIEGTKHQPKTSLFTIVIRTTKMCKTGKRKFTKQHIKNFLNPLTAKSLRIPKKCKQVAYVGFQTEKEQQKALVKDKSFIDGARVRVLKYVSPEESDRNKSTLPWKTAQENLKKAEPVTETGSLFIRNLWYSVTEEDLRSILEKYGQIVDLTLPICKIQRRAKGFAKVTYMFPENAVQAMTGLDGTIFKGRVLHVLPALVDEEEEASTGKSSFKEKQQKEKKATAGSAHNWNTLFIGSGAVADIMAERYNRSKQEILNSEGKQSAAVNLALGETLIVDETKRFLEESGLSLEAFTKADIQRSKTVILVKNLPAKTSAQELQELFSRYGELGRVVLPPTGVTAVVEYLDPTEAKKGYKSLAYSKYKYLPLYLEWAPMNVFKTEYVKEPPKESKPADESKLEDQDEREPEPETTVFVKNLNFDTKEDAIKEHFEKVGEVFSVVIAKRNKLSQGYGFVQFMKKSDAQKALRNLQNSVLQEHTLDIKLSEKTLVTNIKSRRMIHNAGKQTSAKLLVKNVPFQATSKEVRQLFATFGELKSVRMPKKLNSQEHRGFGFVEFATREDAKKAFEALSLSTHLYDRRMVLEWAKEDESVDELRKRTAEKFLSSAPKKKSKLQFDSNENAEEA